MSLFGKSADEIIRRAIQDGAFENLPGKGKPLNLDDNPYEPEEWRTAYRMLRSNGYSLPWLELRKEIEEAVDRACNDARSAWQSGSEEFWNRQKSVFQQRIEALNQRIFQYNLQTPSPVFHRKPLDFSRELDAIQRRDNPNSSQAEGR
jgi:DnaJ family protein C protein 28